MALHWKIVTGLLLGLLFGFGMTFFSWGPSFVFDWIQPFGTIFIRLLKLIAIPLILASLIKGISDLKDISKFKDMGIRTFVTYMVTTIVAILIGLSIVNIFKPGEGISDQTVERLITTYSTDSGVTSKVQTASAQKDASPLQFVVDMVPDNLFHALSDNGLMLQVIFFSILFAISLLLIGEEAGRPIKDVFDALNAIILKMVDLIMLFAPYAVFALLASVVVSSTDPELLLALVKYAGVLLFGLALMIVFYLIVIAFVAKKSPIWFIRNISPAQLLAFSTSSSAATLPVTMERVEEHLGVDKEVASFVLPVGATINMDGTSVYQAVAAVFIAQALSFDLTLGDQLTIILTALLASIGAAAVPGAGMVMLVIVLESIGFPPDKLAIGLALIFAVDRPLDMFRTVVNVTGDAAVAVLVAKTLNKLSTPKPNNWDDHLEEVS